MPQEENRPAIGDSPLLNSGTAPAGGAAPDSSVHPDRLDMSRFSDMSEEDEERSPMRIILFVVAVILIGIAAAFGVRYFLLGDDSETDTSDESETVVEEEASPFTINQTILDNSQASNATLKADYKTSEQISFGDSSVESDSVELSTMVYQPYESFARLTMNFEGTGIPSTNATYDDVENSLTLDFEENLPVADGLDEIVAIGSLVTSVRPDSTENTFTLLLSESFLYNIQVVNGSVLIDMISEEAYETYTDPSEQPEEEEVIPDTETENEETTPPTSVDPDKPSGTNYDNNLSQSKQYVTNVISGNTISYNETFYGDLGNAFELAWGSRNNVGVDYIPNASAELLEDSEGVYIEVVIENLATVSPQETLDQSNMSIPISGANFTSMSLESFESGVATYRVNLRNRADFKLYTDTTISGATQVIALQIND